MSFLTTLNVTAWPLHAHMQQRQRLKNMDRLRNSPNGVVVATDVISRGIDVPDIDNVIHYQIPRSPDIYVHRSGRTARVSFLIIIFITDYYYY